MAGPWERYQAQPEPPPIAGPWQRYQPSSGDIEQMAVDKSATDKMGVGEDVARSLVTGAGEGVTGMAGLLGDVQGLTDDFGKWVGDQLGLPRMTPEQERRFKQPFGLPDISAPTTSAIENMKIPVVGKSFNEMKHDPQTTAGEYARTTGQFVGAGGVMGGPKTALRVGIPAGLASEAAGQMTEGGPFEIPARIAGGVAGGGAGAMMRRAVTPRNIPVENAAAANVLRKEGVRGLTEGQVTQSKKVLAKERQALGSGGDARRLDQLEQFTAATLRKAGIKGGSRATPDVVDGAFDRIGRQFGDLASRNTMRFDQQFTDDLLAAMDDYFSVVPSSQTSPIVQKTVDDVIRVMQRTPGNPTLPGITYQSTRSRLERLARGTKDPELKVALRALREAFDDAMERSLIASNSPDVGAWRQVRNEYRNILVVEDAITTNSSEAALGLITPPALRSAVRRLQGRRNMARGSGDFEELSRAGTGVMTELPLTGTAPIQVRSMLDAGIWLPIEMMKRGARWIRMTEPMQRYLTNRLLPAPSNARPARDIGVTLVPSATDVLRDKNGIAILDARGQQQPR